jgi:phage shock protein E
MAVHDPEFLRKAAEARTRITEIPPTEVDGLRATGATVIDVRGPTDYEAGHIEGATSLPYDEVAKRVQELVPDPSTPVVCYCNAGNRGALAADALQNLGFLNVSSIAGGLTAYLQTKTNADDTACD